MKPSLKKNILIAIAAIAGILLLTAAGLFIYFMFQFTVYQDDQYKFSIKYPKSWKVIPHPQPNVAVVFLRPKDTALDTVQENFNVTIQPLPNDIDNLPAFSARIKKQMTGVFGKSINIVKYAPIHWGWREGQQMILEAPNPDHLKMVNAWVLKGSESVILTFLGDMNKYSSDSLLVGEMIRSLELQ